MSKYTNICLVASRGCDRQEIIKKLDQIKSTEYPKPVQIVIGQYLGDTEFIALECAKRDIKVRVCACRPGQYRGWELAGRVRNRNIISRCQEFYVVYQKGDYIVGSFIKELKASNKEYSLSGQEVNVSNTISIPAMK